MSNDFIRDFTMNKYKMLCESFLNNNYSIYGIYEFLKKRPEKDFIILRHDIDLPPLKCSSKMAELEYDLGINSTYYFRFTKSVFNPKIITEIYNFGHEVGYHYDVLSKTNGDYEKAIELFEFELDEFKKICDIKTVCMHGNPLSKYDNRDLWKNYDFRHYDIAGEAYLSFNKNIQYFSDTGRSWNMKNNIRDFMIGSKKSSIANTTDEMIGLIKSKKIDGMYISAHPERWALGCKDWIFNYTKDFLFNTGKKIIISLR